MNWTSGGRALRSLLQLSKMALSFYGLLTGKFASLEANLGEVVGV